LMEFIGAGKVSGPIVDRYPSPRQPLHLHLRRERLAALLGIAVPDADVLRILRGLGLEVGSAADGWRVVAPTFRVDLQREVDLVEEVGRHYGFDRLEPSFPVLKQAAPPPDPRIARDTLVRRVLAAAGLSEAVTFGFVEEKAAALFGADAARLAIANPLSAKFDTLRPMLLPGLIDAVAHNRRHGRRDVGLFEVGTRFTPSGETRAVGIALTGAVNEHWKDGAREADFFDVKGHVERLADALALPALSFEPAMVSYLVPGQAATVRAGGVPIGVVGRVAPSIVDERGAPKPDAVFAAELDLDAAAALALARAARIAPLPRHPFVVRDLSILVDAALPAEIIRGTIQAAGAQSSLASVGIFDRYQGKGVPDSKVSVSLRLTFQADRTLTDAEVQSQFDAIVAALVREHAAVQR
ncbi:MAG TPA: hypothetical protein VLV86_05940, partial [Vicinamibacterales bacterium]|nr:hypothetical protein [Vicinamibacterales bacterium]